ncbi:zincin-like metallopeptidase domain-containing protein [Erwinia pyrifoliae]|uniref:zincin-like metallopeptidase domain-containing protein n=1 Tax=Erwinia pyrifoliae TaxID=79967 RepID=UPI00223C4CC2|nr:zincin-like metallopeptidase domain-containing protein [Erwinia pyrifoliae]MCT2388873.1 zincin-like metallopeptidase domain-containing protein [Erwinia pyrifoliae]MCU8589067.1 zincin-like metallopeptidase domain-containing protein [Erwinia pyrifoliae]
MASEYAKKVADTIIKQLEQGTAPWIKPWNAGDRFLPHNPTSGKAYKGMNALYLLAVSQERGYDDNRWVTYNQAQAAGAQVNKSGKGQGVALQFWKWEGLTPALDEKGNKIREDGKIKMVVEKYERPKLFSFVVFNAAHIDNMPEKTLVPPLSEWERNQKAEAILRNSGATLEHKAGNSAHYSPSQDKIVLPIREQFPTPDNYYATALHELGHWTGHETRLNRDLKHPFGSEAYAKEELRAEIASMMLGEELGIGHDPGQHVSYIGSWIKALKEDPNEIFRAAADAERISRYVTGLENTLEQEKQPKSAVLEHGMAIRKKDGAQPDLSNDKPEVSERVYLSIPYEEKEEAKAVARAHGTAIVWDDKANSWWTSANSDISPFAKWQIENASSINVMREADPRQEFAEVLKDYGLELDALPDMDGELRRVRVEGDKPDQKSGAYVGYLDGHPAGYVQNFKTGQSQNWKATGTTQNLSNTDKARLAAEAAQRKTERARERDERFGSVLQVIAQRVATSKHALNDHPYLQAKGVEAGEDVYLNEGEAIEFSFTGDKKPPQKWSEKGDLMIAYRDIEGNLMGAQSIDRDGRKSLPRGGRVQGGFHMIGEPAAGKTILVAEGYATGKSLQEISGQPVAVAFHAGNLEAVAQALKTKYPDKPIYIAGDNDHRKEKEIGPDGKPKANVGKEKALDAARATGTHALLPMFSPDDRGSDWNDLVQLKGKEHAREQLRKSVIQAKSKEQLTEQNRKKDAAIIQDKSRVREDEERTKTKVKSR